MRFARECHGLMALRVPHALKERKRFCAALKKRIFSRWAKIARTHVRARCTFEEPIIKIWRRHSIVSDAFRNLAYEARRYKYLVRSVADRISRPRNALHKGFMGFRRALADDRRRENAILLRFFQKRDGLLVRWCFEKLRSAREERKRRYMYAALGAAKRHFRERMLKRTIVAWGFHVASSRASGNIRALASKAASIALDEAVARSNNSPAAAEVIAEVEEKETNIDPFCSSRELKVKCQLALLRWYFVSQSKGRSPFIVRFDGKVLIGAEPHCVMQDGMRAWKRFRPVVAKVETPDATSQKPDANAIYDPCRCVEPLVDYLEAPTIEVEAAVNEGKEDTSEAIMAAWRKRMLQVAHAQRVHRAVNLYPDEDGFFDGDIVPAIGDDKGATKEKLPRHEAYSCTDEVHIERRLRDARVDVPLRRIGTVAAADDEEFKDIVVSRSHGDSIPFLVTVRTSYEERTDADRYSETHWKRASASKEAAPRKSTHRFSRFQIAKVTIV